MAEKLLEIKNLQKKYPIYGPLGKLFPPVNHMRAVADVSLELYEGETYGLVGESGCGKSTTGRSILGLVKPDSGEILYQGKDLTKLSDAEFRPLRADLQMVFQDTLSSLNPRSRIGDLLEEPMIIQNIGTPAERRQKVLDVLTMVGLSEEHYFRYPHEVSGGQVQRLGIARAMIINPRLIICDEPVSALDVTIQEQILNLIADLNEKLGMSVLFITHDLGAMAQLCHSVRVMYLGNLVEEAETEELFENPLHPYTKGLLDCIPRLDSVRGEELPTIEGVVPPLSKVPAGCHFCTRCPYADDRCRTENPPCVEAKPGHKVKCWKFVKEGK